MPRIERTPEERMIFYGERSDILNALTDIQDYDRQSDESKKFMLGLIDTLRDCDNLVNVCGNLAGLAVRRGAVRMGPEKEAPERPVTLKDIRVLGAALRTLLKEMGGNTPERSETAEVIKVKRALARVAPVQLFFAAIHGLRYQYQTKELGKNGVPTITQRERYFGGIPEDKMPTRDVVVGRENLMETIKRVDLGIYPANAKNIYNILSELEKERPTVELGVDPGNKNIVGRRINRAGEAEFFLRRLPKGLKPWAETEQTK